MTKRSVRTITELKSLSKKIRTSCIKYGVLGGDFGAHYGPALSMVEIVATVLDVASLSSPGDPKFSDRDRVILSKGHGSLALYSGLHEFGFISDEIMSTCEQDGSLIPGQPKRNHQLGIEFSSGSLGMGLGFGVGLALSAKMDRSNRKVFVLMGDGETNEGSVWESAMSAAQYELNNLIAIIDANDLQSDGPTGEIMRVNHEATWKAFGWNVTQVDGHSITELHNAVCAPSDKPQVIIASTIKGKGISFMEKSLDWHHGVLTNAQFELALHDVERDYSSEDS